MCVFVRATYVANSINNLLIKFLLFHIFLYRYAQTHIYIHTLASYLLLRHSYAVSLMDNCTGIYKQLIAIIFGSVNCC